MPPEFTGLWRQKLSKRDHKLNGLSLIEFVDLLALHGYPTIEAISKMEVNPLKWSRKQWHFALDLICKSYGITEAQARKQFDTPATMLKAFCECMRQTGLIIQLHLVSSITAEKAVGTERMVWMQKE